MSYGLFICWSLYWASARSTDKADTGICGKWSLPGRRTYFGLCWDTLKATWLWNAQRKTKTKCACKLNLPTPPWAIQGPRSQIASQVAIVLQAEITSVQIHRRFTSRLCDVMIVNKGAAKKGLDIIQFPMKTGCPGPQGVERLPGPGLLLSVTTQLQPQRKDLYGLQKPLSQCTSTAQDWNQNICVHTFWNIL